MSLKTFCSLKASELIELALSDLLKIERDPRYEINMSVWHSGSLDTAAGASPCYVCLAGSVLAKTFRIPVRHRIGHGLECYLHPKIRVRMLFLNMVRGGWLARAAYRAQLCGLEVPEEWRSAEAECAPFVPYNRYGDQWLAWMQDLVGFLRHRGM